MPLVPSLTAFILFNILKSRSQVFVYFFKYIFDDQYYNILIRSKTATPCDREWLIGYENDIAVQPPSETVHPGGPVRLGHPGGPSGLGKLEVAMFHGQLFTFCLSPFTIARQLFPQKVIIFAW